LGRPTPCRRRSSDRLDGRGVRTKRHR